MDAKPFRTRFDKVDGIIKIYERIRYLKLSNSYDKNYRIYIMRFLIGFLIS